MREATEAIRIHGQATTDQARDRVLVAWVQNEAVIDVVS